MSKDKETKFCNIKRCGPLKIKIERRSLAEELKAGLLSLPSSMAMTSPSSSTIVLPSTSPLATLSTSFESRGIKNEFFQPELLLTSTPDSKLPPQFHNLFSLPSPAPSPIYSIPALQNQLRPVGVSPPRFALASPSTHGQLRPIRPVPRTSPLLRCHHHNWLSLSREKQR